MSSDLAGPPPGGTRVPPATAGIPAHDPVELVWQNEVGGITARIDRSGGAVFAKWCPAGTSESLGAEAARMRWLEHEGTVPVPRVIVLTADATRELLVTAAREGASIVSAVGRRDPEAAAAALGERFHKPLPDH